jgi:hypothetical protein
MFASRALILEVPETYPSFLAEDFFFAAGFFLDASFVAVSFFEVSFFGVSSFSGAAVAALAAAFDLFCCFTSLTF